MKGRPPKPPLERFSRLFTPAASGCWLWNHPSQFHGYGQFHNGERNRRAHVASWELHCGPIPNGLVVCHKCDVKHCVNPAHLFLGTHQDNMHDMISKGRRASFKGEKHGNAKLTDKQARQIKRGLAAGLSCSALAQKFNVSRRVISQIRAGITWKHIKLEKQENDDGE